MIYTHTCNHTHGIIQKHTHTCNHLSEMKSELLLTERTFDIAEKSNGPDAREVPPTLCLAELDEESGKQKRCGKSRMILC